MCIVYKQSFLPVRLVTCGWFFECALQMMIFTRLYNAFYCSKKSEVSIITLAVVYYVVIYFTRCKLQWWVMTSSVVDRRLAQRADFELPVHDLEVIFDWSWSRTERKEAIDNLDRTFCDSLFHCKIWNYSWKERVTTMGKWNIAGCRGLLRSRGRPQQIWVQTWCQCCPYACNTGLQEWWLN